MSSCRGGLSRVDVTLLNKMFERAVATRTPLSGSIELTRRCNLRCVHCYQQICRASADYIGDEMDTASVIRIIDECTDAGALQLALTGGDPLMRTDFAEIYTHAVRRGLLVTILCNGTLISEDTISLFRDYPPRMVEMTLSGATGPVHESVTRVPGSYEALLRGIHRLKQSGIRFSLKTVLLTLNAHELEEMERLAVDFGVNYRYDTMVFPAFGGGDCAKKPKVDEGDVRDVLSYRLTPEIIARIDTARAERRTPWMNNYRKFGGSESVVERLYYCGAGLTDFHIGPGGTLHPCILMPNVCYDLSKGTFLQGWDVIAAIRDVYPGGSYPCNVCRERSLCAGCPAVFALESGSPEDVPGDICRTTRLRVAGLEPYLKYPLLEELEL